MNPQARNKPDDTRARIIETAEALFRRLGYAKTAVADIAAELGMSPANVYRFFPSKNAIVEAICKICLNECEESAWTVARSRAPAASRLERVVLEILAYHKDNLISEQRVYDMVLVAMEHSWDAILAHKEVMLNVFEVIVRDGIATGEFETVDPRETARQIMRAMVASCHPVLIAQAMQDGEDVEAEARAAVAFLLNGIKRKA
jgi:AcrR family transcriptional regulator